MTIDKKEQAHLLKLLEDLHYQLGILMSGEEDAVVLRYRKGIEKRASNWIEKLKASQEPLT